MTLVMSDGLVKLGVFCVPLAILGTLLLIRHLDTRWYRAFLYEDSVAEWSSALCYALAAVLAFLVARTFLRSGERWLGFCYCVITVAMFVIFAEEISWGQRVFGIDSPEYFLKNSSQREINIHNLKPVQEVLHVVYAVVGALGAFLWIPRAFSSGSGPILNCYLVPGWYLMSYFLPVFLFYGYYETLFRTNDVIGLIPRDQEPSELVLALGFLLFILRTWLTVSGTVSSRFLSISLDGDKTPALASPRTPETVRVPR